MKQRIITALVLGIFFSFPLYYGDWIFTSLCLVLGIIGIYEFAKMDGIRVLSLPFIVSLLGVTFFLYPVFLNDHAIESFPAVFLLLLVFLTLTVFTHTFSFPKAGTMFLGVLYIGYGFASIADARLENGLAWTLCILILIWGTDSGAYFIGKAIGKRKLIEAVSPNKTVEGFLGGIAVSVVLVSILQFSFGIFESFGQAALLAIVIAVSGQVGDLIESAMKRHYGVKDSGKIFPGHGGVLDRTDSWIFVFIGLSLLGMI